MFYKGWIFLQIAIASLATPTFAASLPQDCSNLGGALVEHSCFHTTFGPWKTLTATAGSLATPTTANLDSPHTEHRVGLTGNTSVVAYTPARGGAWTIFLDSAVPIRVLDDGGRELKQILSTKGNLGCDALKEAHIFDLNAGQRYSIVVGPTPTPTVVIVVEHVGDFVTENGRDKDRDGYGDPNDTLLTPCVPPANYVQNADDCDDTNPLLNPGVIEICDGIDQNCNGLPDDVGIECRVGRGTCTAVGKQVCDGAPRSIVRCNAQPAAASTEVCNGKDDDCDGTIDGTTNICAGAPDTPTCVRDGNTASCSCILDLDCGPGDSGRICDGATRRCVDGCSLTPGRNTCPKGFSCVVSGNTGMCKSDTPTVTMDAGVIPLPSVDSTSESGCGCRIGRRTSTPETGASAILLFLIALGTRWIRRKNGAQTRRLSLVETSRKHGATLIVLLTASGFFNCGGRNPLETDNADPGKGGTQGRPNVDALEPEPVCIPEIGPDAVAHACSHTNNGPYVSVVAHSTDTPDVTPVHKTFNILVKDQGASVLYRARRNGTHVILTDREIPIDVIDMTTMQTISGNAFEVSGCRTIEFARRTDMVDGKSYLLKLNAIANSSLKLYVEYLPAFGAKAWKTSCEQPAPTASVPQ